MGFVVHVIPLSESATSETTDSSGEITEKLEITSPELAFGIAFYREASVKEITVFNALEFLKAEHRNNFFDQCYKILTDDGKMTVTVPYWNSWRAYYDSRFEWPPFCEQSFLCYNKSWREANMKGLELESDWDFTYGYAWSADTQARNDESRSFWTAHYTNCVDALQLVFTKRAKG